MFDLNANPSVEERRQLARERPVIAAESNPDGSFHGLFIPKQPVAEDATQLVGITCKHSHTTVLHALLCANAMGSELIVQGYGEIVSA